MSEITDPRGPPSLRLSARSVQKEHVAQVGFDIWRRCYIPSSLKALPLAGLEIAQDVSTCLLERSSNMPPKGPGVPVMRTLTRPAAPTRRAENTSMPGQPTVTSTRQTSTNPTQPSQTAPIASPNPSVSTRLEEVSPHSRMMWWYL
jgi:hypothetical protein